MGHPRFKSIFPGADGRPWGGEHGPVLIHPGVSVRSATRLSPLVAANGSDPAGSDRSLGSWVIHFALWLATKCVALWRHAEFIAQVFGASAIKIHKRTRSARLQVGGAEVKVQRWLRRFVRGL